MAYDKYTWQTGEVITQEKLNHMEQGIENAYELPAVTSEDDGKFLGVENGQFGLISGGGSSGEKIFRVTFADNGDNTLTADKTRAEIFQAYVDDLITIGELRVTMGTPTTISDIAAVEWSFITFLTGGLEVTLDGNKFISSSTEAGSSVIWHKL